MYGFFKYKNALLLKDVSCENSYGNEEQNCIEVTLLSEHDRPGYVSK